MHCVYRKSHFSSSFKIKIVNILYFSSFCVCELPSCAKTRFKIRVIFRQLVNYYLEAKLSSFKEHISTVRCSLTIVSSIPTLTLTVISSTFYRLILFFV